MKKNEIKIEVDATVAGKNELIIREGAADPVVPHRENVNVLGNIAVVSEHLKKPSNWLVDTADGYPDAPLSSSFVTVDRNLMTIQFDEDAGAVWQAVYIGQLKLNPDFLAFRINASETYSPHALADKIKFSRSFFESKTVAMKLVSELKSFEMKIDKVVENHADERANKRVLVAQAVETNLPDAFKLKMPIFKGGPDFEFQVELSIDPRDFEVRLLSPDVADYLIESRDEIIDEQIDIIAELHPTLRIFEK